MRPGPPYVWLICALAALGCAEAKKQVRLGMGGAGAYVGSPGTAAVNQPQPDMPSAIGAAIAASVVSRAVGGCLAWCPAGTACNVQTGMCDTLPCRGQCKDGEVCENDRCVSALKPPLIIDQR